MAARFPQELADRAELLSRSHGVRAVSAILRVSQGTIIGMKRNGWRPRDNSCQLRPMPTDFAIMNSRLRNIRTVATHYRASTNTVARWRRELRG